MEQQKEPKPLTLKERRKIAWMVIVLIITGIIVFGLLDLLFPIPEFLK